VIDSPFIRQHQDRGCASSEFHGFAFSAHRARLRSFRHNLSPALQVHCGPVWLVDNALPSFRAARNIEVLIEDDAHGSSKMVAVSWDQDRQ
jgi:hypothetical protein